MQTYIVGKEDAGKRLDRYMGEKRPDLSRIFILKALRLKKIRRNGKRAEGSDRLEAGDSIDCRLAEGGARPVRTDGFSVVYEDDHVLIVDKKPGVLCEDQTGKETNTLEAQVNAYLAPKGETARLCHRIDYNTAGLVVLAKDAPALAALTAAIRDRLVEKRYLCVAVGDVRPASGTLSGQLFKDARKNRVYVTDTPVKGSRTAVTRYRVMDRRGGLSLVECTLVTGRTHQIRCQMAHAGWPLLGDEKYGQREANHRCRERRQLLKAYRIHFAFSPETPVVGYLAGQTVTAPRVSFRETYFGNRTSRGQKGPAGSERRK